MGNFKSLKQELRLIKSLDKSNSVTFKYNEDFFSGSLEKGTKDFLLNINSSNRFKLGDMNNLKFQFQDYEITLTNFFERSREFCSRGGNSLTVKIFEFEINGFEQHLPYCRTIIPLKRSLSFNNILSDSFEDYETEESIIRGLLRIKIPNYSQIHVFIYEKDFLVIDGIEAMTKDIFSELSWSVLVGIGYITGYLPQDEEYFFYYNDSELIGDFNFSFKTMRNSIYSIYAPVNANSHAWRLPAKSADEYYGRIRELGIEHFSLLCNLIHDIPDIKAMLLLLVESVSSSMLLMPAGLSVVLEGISEYFYNKYSFRIAPIDDKQLSSRIIADLKDVLKNYQQDPHIKNFTVLNRKLETLNSPTNREKLKFPFNYLKIPIDKLAEEVIEFRNDFLHGNINLNPKKGRPVSMDSFEISLRLLTLINAIFMKMIGYDGLILNHAKLQEKGIGKDIYEEPFLKIE
ncbi:hypothetical protein [Pedobacter sp. WC2423]|uniref:hypothetical protein n=1 Tax=Pedobacter sp. WC2423 TaxID=3234142 RepID=UPI0034679658